MALATQMDLRPTQAAAGPSVPRARSWGARWYGELADESRRGREIDGRLAELRATRHPVPQNRDGEKPRRPGWRGVVHQALDGLSRPASDAGEAVIGHAARRLAKDEVGKRIAAAFGLDGLRRRRGRRDEAFCAPDIAPIEAGDRTQQACAGASLRLGRFGEVLGMLRIGDAVIQQPKPGSAVRAG